jgi:hypothetical protein
LDRTQEIDAGQRPGMPTSVDARIEDRERKNAELRPSLHRFRGYSVELVLGNLILGHLVLVFTPVIPSVTGLEAAENPAKLAPAGREVQGVAPVV